LLLLSRGERRAFLSTDRRVDGFFLEEGVPSLMLKFLALAREKPPKRYERKTTKSRAPRKDLSEGLFLGGKGLFSK